MFSLKARSKLHKIRIFCQHLTDFLIAKHMKPCMHIFEISISSLNRFVVRPTKTPKSAKKNCQFLTFKVTFLCQKISESF